MTVPTTGGREAAPKSATIAVGVDGSAASVVALRWALGAAAVRGADLLAVIAERARTDKASESFSAQELQPVINEHLARVTQLITDTANGAAVQIDVRDGSPTEVLLAVSARVDLLVVGGNGYGGWRDHFTASVTGRLAVHTQAAVCVVRRMAERERGRIVVGYAGRTSADAVEFALCEAALRGASALVVSTWQYPRDTRATSPEAAGILEEGASAALREIVIELRRDHPDVVIDTVVRLGHPVDVLAQLAESADLVVIGSHRDRGFLHGGFLHGGFRHGGLATLVVGSVAIGLLRQLDTPVVIVPHGP